jgi:hypothetical protein
LSIKWMKTMRWWDTKRACSTRVHAETQHRFWWNIFSSYEWYNIPILNIIDSLERPIHASHGCCDSISFWVTTFGYLYESSWRVWYSEQESFSQHLLCKS